MNKSTARSGRVVVVHGGRAGEGKSLLAENLASVWTLEGRRVLLLDLDRQAGNSQLLRGGIERPVTLASLPDGGWHREEAAGSWVFPKTACGVEVAVLVETPAQALEKAMSRVGPFLEAARLVFDAVVVDSLCGFDRPALRVLDAADLILTLCPPDLAGLRQVKTDSRRYQELKFPAAKLGLVLNRTDLPGALSPAEIGRLFPQQRVWAALPFAIQAVEALHAQRALVRLYPHSLFAGAVGSLAGKISAADFSCSRSDIGSGQPAAVAHDHPPDSNRLKQRLHGLLLENAELKDLAVVSGRSPESRALLRARVEAVVADLMATEAAELPARDERARLAREVADEALGLGPLEDLMRDPEVTEIMVNGCSRIYVEKQGRLHVTGKYFLQEEQLRTVVERIIAPLGRRLDESRPYVDARLSDGSRVHALIPPLSLRGPVVTIRKFSRKRLEVDDLIAYGSLTRPMADFLAACIIGRKNLIISGGTGSGKTTLLNILAGLIPDGERIITIEDAAELNLPQPHVVSLEAKPANLEGKGEVAIRELVRNSLRMRPDRIVVGECRGGEALDMLQAMNTGHDGSLTTAHANSPRDLLLRLETMVLMSGLELPVRAIRQQIAGAVHIIIQQERLQDGSRKVTRISEVGGETDGQVQLQDVFIFRQTGLDNSGKVLGVFKATGHTPACMPGLKAKGVVLEEQIFTRDL